MTVSSGKPWAAILPRAIVAVTGPDAIKFLQGLISNDAAKALPGRVVYSFLLSPQGKYLFDFFLRGVDGGVEIDIAAEDADSFAAKLQQYKLRSKATIELREGLTVAALAGATVPDALPDPRVPSLGHRLILPREGANAALAAAGFVLHTVQDYEAHRLSLGVPDHHDFVREQSFLLECNGEELHGVDFRKGCYVGQELTARMKHRGTARRRILRVTGAGMVRGAAILDGAREVGEVLSVQGQIGVAAIRLDRWREARGRPLTANGMGVEVSLPAYPLHLPPEEATS